MMSDNSGEVGDSIEIKTLNGITTINSDHNVIGNFNAEILRLSGNATSTERIVETPGKLKANSIDLDTNKLIKLGDNGDMNIFLMEIMETLIRQDL